jgi:hypothetical protein
MSRLGTGLKAVPDRLQWLEFNWEWIIVRPLRPTPDLGAGRSKGPEGAHSEHARNRACSVCQSDPNEPPGFYIALTLNLLPPRLALRQALMV